MKWAEALGYGNQEDYEKFYAEIASIEDKTQGGQYGQGFFDRIRARLSDAMQSIFG